MILTETSVAEPDRNLVGLSSFDAKRACDVHHCCLRGAWHARSLRSEHGEAEVKIVQASHVGRNRMKSIMNERPQKSSFRCRHADAWRDGQIYRPDQSLQSFSVCDLHSNATKLDDITTRALLPECRRQDAVPCASTYRDFVEVTKFLQWTCKQTFEVPCTIKAHTC